MLRGGLLACGLLVVALAEGCQAENHAAIKEFGIEKSKPMRSSFFFWNYAYVESPYVVERRGLDVLVNGIMIRQGPPWPQSDYLVEDDPGDPPPKWDFWKDERAYSGKKWAYLTGKYELDEARKMMVDWYSKRTEVAEVQWQPGDMLVEIKTKDGKTGKLILDTWWKEFVRSKEDLLAEANTIAKRYETILSRKAGLLWMGENMPEVGMGAAKVLQVMLSDLPAEEKVKRLEEQNLVVVPQIRRLVAECRYSDQLAKRYERLKKGFPDEEFPEPPPAPGDVQPLQATHSKAIPYPWLVGGLAVLAVVITLVAWRLRRK